MTAARSGRASVLLCYLLLASLYLLYLPYVNFVLDDWYMVQKFEQARAHGFAGEWRLAVDLVRNQVWGVARLQGLSFLSVYGLYLLAGQHPWFYFLLGLVFHTSTAFLLYVTLRRLAFNHQLAGLTGALFILLPTARNPLFWFPNCGQYLLAAFLFVLYLYALSDAVLAPRLTLRAAAFQVLVLVFAVFSTDQLFALLLFAVAWMAFLWPSPAVWRSALLAWVVAPTAAFFYFRVINIAHVAGSIGAKFQFTPAQLVSNLRAIGTDYLRLAGLHDPYYHPAALGAAALLPLAAGLVVFWWLRREPPGPMLPTPLSRALLLGLGLWLAAYGPVLFLGWRELRYDYLPSIGLAIFLAAVTAALLRPWPRTALPAAAGLLVALSAATAVAEIRQCWIPMSRHIRFIETELRRLPQLAYHDNVVIAGTPLRLGTAPHFGMFNSYTSTPFVETVTGVWGLNVARDLLYDYGRLGLEHTDFFHEIRPGDLAHTHLIACAPDLTCALRTLLARPLGSGRYELHSLKGYAGPALDPARAYSVGELAPLRAQLYIARVLP
jgi:hypothetical protein